MNEDPISIAKLATGLYLELRRRQPDWPEDHIRYIALHLATPLLEDIDPLLSCEDVFQHHGEPWEDLCSLHISIYMTVAVFQEDSEAAVERMGNLSLELYRQIQQTLAAPEKERERGRAFLDGFSRQDLLDIAAHYTYYAYVLKRAVEDDDTDGEQAPDDGPA